jgi:hypothetical protein
MKTHFLAVATIGLWFLGASVCLATTYYVDGTNGNDTNSGTSPALAWKTIGHVNGITFSPGDSILFHAPAA